MILLNRRPHPVLATRSVFPLQEEKQPRYAEPLPARATLGHVTLINDNEAFFQGLNSSIEMYFGKCQNSGQGQVTEGIYPHSSHKKALNVLMLGSFWKWFPHFERAFQVVF
jgi:hypothetical protein